LGSIQLAQQLAFLVALVSALLLVLGLPWLRATWPALAYLLLMVPIWDGFTEPLHWPFQHLSAAIGIEVLQALHIPAYGEGRYLVLPDLTIEVARACSGINYLIAVLALGLPLAYLYLPTNGRRVALVTSAVLVAALSNGLRVALIGILAYLDIGSPLHGPAHVLHGLFVAGVGYVVLFAGLHALAPRPSETAPTPHAQPKPRHLDTVEDRFAVSIWNASALGVLFLAVGLSLQFREPSPVPLKAALERLPYRLGRWTGSPAGEGRSAWWPGADDQLRRSYRAAGAPDVDLYVAYFATQRQGKEAQSYRSAELHRTASVVSVHVPGGRSFAANLTRLTEAPRERQALFWYEFDGTIQTGQLAAKLLTMWHAVSRGHTNGAVVLLATHETGSGESRQAPDPLLELAGLVHRELAACLPSDAASAAGSRASLTQDGPRIVAPAERQAALGNGRP